MLEMKPSYRGECREATFATSFSLHISIFLGLGLCANVLCDSTQGLFYPVNDVSTMMFTLRFCQFRNILYLIQ